MYTKEEVQRHLECLTKNPERIYNDWSNAKPLFAFVGPANHPQSGCLTMIRENPSEEKAVIKGVVDEKLTKEIALDKRLPISYTSITVEHLPVFAEWQNRIIDLQNA